MDQVASTGSTHPDPGAENLGPEAARALCERGQDPIRGRAEILRGTPRAPSAALGQRHERLVLCGKLLREAIPHELKELSGEFHRESAN